MSSEVNKQPTLRTPDHSGFLIILVGVYITVLILTVGVASKFVAIGPFTLNGATVVFPITFIFNDIFTEVYGYDRSRKIIWTGLFAQAFAAFIYWLVGALPAAQFWTNQAAYDAILGQSPRIALASLTAYFWGEYANSVVMSKMKFKQHGARGLSQSWRFVASTVVGEAIDTGLFFPLAFFGVIPTSELLKTMGIVYVTKVLYEVIALPLSTRAANWVKGREHVDEIDDPATTSYSPLLSGEREPLSLQAP